MKTPTELLFDRHKNAMPKLDAIRLKVIDRRFSDDKEGSRNLFLYLYWQLIHPCRQIWIGLAAVWILLLAVNFSQRDDSQDLMARSAPTPEMLIAFHRQEKMLNEMLSDHSQSEESRPQKVTPKTRSEAARIIIV